MLSIEKSLPEGEEMPNQEVQLHQSEPFNLRHHKTYDAKPEKPKIKISLPVVLVSIFILIVTILAIGTLLYANQQKKVLSINDFESCAAAGNPVAQSYPATCRTSDGRSFTQTLSEEEQKKLDPTTGWKTYTNNEYSFLIKYPKELEHETDLLKYDQYDIVNEIFSEKIGEKASLSIDVNSCDLIIPPGENKVTEKIIIDGKELTKYYMDDKWTSYNQITIPNNPKFHALCFTAKYQDLNNREEYENIFDQILSTFKFTDEGPTPTCTPRPTCLDNPTSMCNPLEPSGGWCSPQTE